MAGNAATKASWGVTDPISLAMPSKKDLELNDSLLDELRRQNNFESTEETERRKQVLGVLQKVTEEFVRHVGKKRKLAPSVIDAAGGMVFTFGSYRLGVYGPGTFYASPCSLKY
jgi:poly(A) polymerase